MLAEAAIIGGLVISVLGRLMGGSAQREAMRRQANYEEMQAAIAMQDGAYSAWKVRQASAQRVSSAKVNYANSGVDTGEGTARETLAQFSAAGSLEEHLAEVAGQRVAWTHKEKARLLRAGINDVSSAETLGIGVDIANAVASYTAIGDPANKKPGGGLGDVYDDRRPSYAGTT